ncbi:MAG: response regulator [Acidobacteriota bacterium]|nr:response regulator [Acidobacteriota bacterium]
MVQTNGENERPSILIAEDNLINQKVIERMVQKLGYRADLVSNGREALDALARVPYGLVFMDCQMPEMDGFEACREIRSRDLEGARLPIIAITANAMKGDRERCLAAGMDDYVSKPFKQDDLKNVLEKWIPVAVSAGLKVPVGQAFLPAPGFQPTSPSPEVLDQHEIAFR